VDGVLLSEIRGNDDGLHAVHLTLCLKNEFAPSREIAKEVKSAPAGVAISKRISGVQLLTNEDIGN